MLDLYLEDLTGEHGVEDHEGEFGGVVFDLGDAGSEGGHEIVFGGGRGGWLLEFGKVLVFAFMIAVTAAVVVVVVVVVCIAFKEVSWGSNDNITIDAGILESWCYAVA